jgi:2'-5' RNA ligase
VGQEIDGLRRALGDQSLGRVAPHLTLVPPVNISRDRTGEALATMRRAAAAAPRSLTLVLGPVSTFLPVNPVLFLAVSGDTAGLGTLRDAVFSGPFERPLRWPWVPHVTLADQLDEARLGAALATLDRYRAEVAVGEVHVLHEVGRGPARRWEPVADSALGPPALVGRGGLAVELVRSTGLDPEGASLVASALPGGTGPPPAVADSAAGPRPPIVLTARREGAVVGVAVARLGDDGARIGVLVDPAGRGQGIGGHLLAATEAAVAEAGWTSRVLVAVGPAGFYRARSRWSVPYS